MWHITSVVDGVLVFETRISIDGEHAYGQAYQFYRNAPKGDGTNFTVSVTLETK